MRSMKSALFLDLGGTLVRVENDEIYTDSDGKSEFLPNVVDTLKTVVDEFDSIFIVTNQSGIEKGILTVEKSNSFINQVNSAIEGRITDFWVCPFKESEYRKPNPGMILGLADKHFIALSKSVMVGDSEIDRQCAKAAGVYKFIWANIFFEW